MEKFLSTLGAIIDFFQNIADIIAAALAALCAAKDVLGKSDDYAQMPA